MRAQDKHLSRPVRGGAADAGAADARATQSVIGLITRQLRARGCKLDIQLRYTLPTMADAALAARRTSKL